LQITDRRGSLLALTINNLFNNVHVFAIVPLLLHNFARDEKGLVSSGDLIICSAEISESLF
jgi:hypothetical protein